MTTGSSDPGSTSALGGTLRSHALGLTDLAVELEEAARRSTRSTRSTRSSRGDPTARERDLLSRAARELDAVGAVLQSFTATALASAARLRELADEAARADLFIDGNLVVERAGPSRVDPHTRLTARTRLQELLNRVRAAEGKETARLAREIARSAPVLGALSERARSGS